MRISFFVVITCLGAVVATADPFVMVHQAVISRQPIGVETGFDIDYTIINMAEEAAKILAINNIHSKNHDPLPESIPGHGGRIQFRVHIVPDHAGPYKPAPLKVDYVFADQIVQSVYSTEADSVDVLTQEDYATATEKFVKQYTIFASIAGVLVTLPALLIVRDYLFYTHGCPNNLLAPYRRSKQN